MLSFFFFKQKTAYDMRISDWSSDVCSSDLFRGTGTRIHRQSIRRLDGFFGHCWLSALFPDGRAFGCLAYPPRSGESEYSYNDAVVYQGGKLYPARIVKAPFLQPLVFAGDDVSVELESELGRTRLEGITTLGSETRRGGKGCGNTCRSRG